MGALSSALSRTRSGFAFVFRSARRFFRLLFSPHPDHIPPKNTTEQLSPWIRITLRHYEKPRSKQDWKGVSIEDVQRDWHLLDDSEFALPERVRLISHEQFTSCPSIAVEYIPPGLMARAARVISSRLYFLFYAFQLLHRCSENTVLILNGGGGLWLFVGLLNRFLSVRKRRILCWDIFVEVAPGWKRRVMSAAMKGVTLSVLWSRAQISPHSRFLDIPEDQFVFIPFKANHSKHPRYHNTIGRFVFSGGNSKRDYGTLVEAVRDTSIPVIISCTDPKVKRDIQPPPNVIVLAASEPAFAQLQAASSFVVIPMVPGVLRGAGEANFCNAMWHGKPVIAADSIAASDYIINGETGYVVPSGDVLALRERILALWNDEDRCKEMGNNGHEHVKDNLTHEMFIRRLLRLALLLGRATPVYGDQTRESALRGGANSRAVSRKGAGYDRFGEG